jgi:transcriptional regulator with XRE-family HTH domain
MPKKYNAARPEWDRERIQALRHHLGLTQQEMAAQMGTRQQTISEWETGMYQPRGASSTLLSLIAEKAGFQYDANEINSKIKRQKAIPGQERAHPRTLIDRGVRGQELKKQGKS